MTQQKTSGREVEIQPKPQIASLSQWVNGLATVAGVVQLVADQGLVPPQYIPYVFTCVGIANLIIRRYKTDGPVSGIISSPPPDMP